MARRQRRDRMVFESSCHLSTTHTVEASYCFFFQCWTSSREAVNANFYSLWFDPTWNRTRVYRFVANALSTQPLTGCLFDKLSKFQELLMRLSQMSISNQCWLAIITYAPGAHWKTNYTPENSLKYFGPNSDLALWKTIARNISDIFLLFSSN